MQNPGLNTILTGCWYSGWNCWYRTYLFVVYTYLSSHWISHMMKLVLFFLLWILVFNWSCGVPLVYHSCEYHHSTQQNWTLLHRWLALARCWWCHLQPSRESYFHFSGILASLKDSWRSMVFVWLLGFFQFWLFGCEHMKGWMKLSMKTWRVKRWHF